MGLYQHEEVIRHRALSHTSKAVDESGRSVILRVFSSGYMDEYGGQHDLSYDVLTLIPDLLKLSTIPPCTGVARWHRFEVINDRQVLRFERAFYPHLLSELFAPAPDQPPSAALLQAFRELATGFDHLTHHLVAPFFYFHPNNLVSDGQHAFLTDYGLTMLTHVTDGAYEGPRRFYPGWTCEMASCFALEPFDAISPDVKRLNHVKPVFTLASLYTFLRLGHGPFIDSALPPKSNHKFDLLATFWPAHSLANAYHQHGTVTIKGLLPAERDVITRALIPGSTIQSCAALMDELVAVCK